ncbi:MAG: glycosyltransferase family 39 protein [Taibaiella sp.]|nr:glycosyltransferase family 39 protein [Taibaiella sp.]
MAYPNRLLLQEFPLMQWLFALAFKIFGPHVVISRLLSFGLGMLSVYGMFFISARVLNDKLYGAATAWAFCFSPVFHYYTVNPMPDNFALCLSIWGIAAFLSYTRSRRMHILIVSTFLLGVSALVKLPYVMFMAFPVSWLIIQFLSGQLNARVLLYAGFAVGFSLLPALFWYTAVVNTWGQLEVISGVLGAGKTLWELTYILQGTIISVLPELLINYAALPFFLVGFWALIKQGALKNWIRSPFGILLLVLIAYYLYEMAAIDTVHDYYLLPFLPLLFLIVGVGIKWSLSHFPKRWLWVTAVSCLLLMPVTAFVRCYSRWDVKTDTGFARVFYDYKDIIISATPDNALCVIGADQSDMVLLYYADRVGWTYDYHGLDEAKLLTYIRQGARYLYATDNLPDDPAVRAHLKGLILQQENLRIYSLRDY